MTQVIVTQNDSIAAGIEEACGYLDFRAKIAGRTVAVKTNETWASEEDKTGVTQPDTLRAVLAICEAVRSPRVDRHRRIGGGGDG